MGTKIRDIIPTLFPNSSFEVKYKNISDKIKKIPITVRATHIFTPNALKNIAIGIKTVGPVVIRGSNKWYW